MHLQRVLFSDSVNGKQFNFAIVYKTFNKDHSARLMGEIEFPQATIVEVTNVSSPE